MPNKMIYKISKEKHNEKDLKKMIQEYPELKFVSLMGVDLYGHDTEERIPIQNFCRNMGEFLNGVAVQTDGSSVSLPEIATLNDAKIDMVVDNDVDWFVDYNNDFVDEETGKLVGTIIIPCFLCHAGVAVDSRSILKEAEKTFTSTMLELFNKYPEALKSYDIKAVDIDHISIDTASELEFWVKTPNDKAEIEALTASQSLQEQYWARISGPVRTALEKTLVFMDKYELNPEMGHKETGGIKAKLDSNGKYNHIMEQLEIDWKYSTAMQTSDNQLFIRNLIQQTFLMNGLETTFMSKPIEDVAGNGMHIHLGAKIRLKDGRKRNLFTADGNGFLGEIGYGALMGLLKNYEVMNPFISSTYDSLKRLKPGYEAPICIVTSLGLSEQVPSRNRTVLVGLIRDVNTEMATRFELRSPNPRSNIYLATAVSYLAMLDGIKYVIEKNKKAEELLKEISKKYGEKADYLETDREYRSEEDIFETYGEEEINKLFGYAPKSIYENLENFDKYPDKLKTLQANGVFSDKIIDSYKMSVLQKWKDELVKRIINNYTDEIKEYKPRHTAQRAEDNDLTTWGKISDLRKYIAKDMEYYDCLCTRIKKAIKEEDYKLASDLSIELEEKITELRKLYSDYAKNVLDV